MKHQTLCSLLFCLVFFSVNAQETVKEYERLALFTAASVQYIQYTTNRFESELVQGEITTSELKAYAQYPWEFEDKGFTWLNGIDFTLLSPSVIEENNDVDITRNFYAISYNMGFIQEVGKKNWSVMAFLKPTLASDFQTDFSGEDFIFQVAGFTTKRVNEFWEFGFGASLNTRFGNEQLLPLLYYFRKKGKWETDFFFPSHLRQFYCFENSKIGLSGAIDGNNYNFENTVIPNLDLDKLSYSRVNIGPVYEFKIFRDVYANVQGGVTIMNRQTWNDQLKNQVLDMTPEDKLFFIISLKYLR